MIILTYGQPKSASSYFNQIIMRCCDIKYGSQPVLRTRLCKEFSHETLTFWSGDLSPIRDLFGSLNPNETLVLKTHSPKSPAILEDIEQGRIVPMITYRNIGDAALSVFEAGKMAREAGDRSQGFYKIGSHREAIDYINGHVKTVTIPWLALDRTFSYSYEDVTKRPNIFLSDIATLLDIAVSSLTADPEIRNMLDGTKRIFNFNKGVSNRYKEVFSEEDLAYLESKCGPFMDFCAKKIDYSELKRLTSS